MFNIPFTLFQYFDSYNKFAAKMKKDNIILNIKTTVKMN